MSVNFTEAAFSKGTLDAARIQETGDAYVALLLDLDMLVGSDSAFLLGPVIASARAWAGNASDCAVSFDPGFACGDFYECAWFWRTLAEVVSSHPAPFLSVTPGNARVQVTTVC